MKLKSIMKTDVATVDMDVPLRSISRMFKEKKFHHVVVVEDDEICGIISERDVLKAWSPFLGTPSEQNRDLATLGKRAHQIMSRHPVTITADADVEDAVRIILGKQISCLPVVSTAGQLVGIVTWKDLLKVYSEQACVAV